MLYRTIASVAGAVMLTGCSVVGIRSGYEGPDYTVVDQIGDDIEIRRYPARLAAEATVDEDARSGRNQAFRTLFDYISGANQGQSDVSMTVPVEVAPAAEEIAMTVPVETTTSDTGQTTMRFFLPSSYTSSTAPEPTDPSVRIVDMPETTEAVLRFTGLGSESEIEKRRNQLRQALEGSAWLATAPPTTLFYDPPWTIPFLRRNEIAVQVIEKPSSPDG